MENVLTRSAKHTSNQNFLTFFRHVLNLISFLVFSSGVVFSVNRLHFGLMLSGVLIIYLADILFCFERLKDRIVMLLFFLTMFLFLMGRAVINLFRDENWWDLYSESGLTFALFALYISLTCIQIGAVLFCFAESRIPRFKKMPKKPNSPLLAKHNEQIKYVALSFFLLCWMCFMYIEFDKMASMAGKNYEDYYVTYQTDAPFMFGTLSAMCPMSLCIFLATFPTKKQAFLPLMMYFFSAVPMLIIGQRTQIALNAMFVFLYYYVRGKFDNQKPWIGKFEKTALVLLLPVAVILLAVMNYTRDGKSVDMNVGQLIIDFLEKQGVSFKVLTLGYDAVPKLHNTPLTNYTFGPLLDYWLFGFFGQKLLGAPSLGTGNNEFRATHGNSFAHSMSFVAKDDYLSGHGWGSSFLLELYADFGWIGIILFSLLLGMLMVFVLRLLRRGVLLSSISLLMCAELFLIPRAEATGWLLFLGQPHFWIAFLVCIAVGSMLFTSCKKDRYKYKLKSEVI